MMKDAMTRGKVQVSSILYMFVALSWMGVD